MVEYLLEARQAIHMYLKVALRMDIDSLRHVKGKIRMENQFRQKFFCCNAIYIGDFAIQQ
jgi:hypothetical protein